MSIRDAVGNFRDGELARGLVELLGRDGWLVEFHRIDGNDWEARVLCPWRVGPVVGQGSSRVSAITKAHVESIRSLGRVDGLVDVARPPGSREIVLTP